MVMMVFPMITMMTMLMMMFIVYDGQVRRFAMAQPILLAGINSKVCQLFPAIAEEEVIIVFLIVIATNIKITLNETMVGQVQEVMQQTQRDSSPYWQPIPLAQLDVEQS